MSAIGLFYLLRFVKERYCWYCCLFSMPTLYVCGLTSAAEVSQGCGSVEVLLLTKW